MEDLRMSRMGSFLNPLVRCDSSHTHTQVTHVTHTHMYVLQMNESYHIIVCDWYKWVGWALFQILLSGVTHVTHTHMCSCHTHTHTCMFYKWMSHSTYLRVTDMNESDGLFFKSSCQVWLMSHTHTCAHVTHTHIHVYFTNEWVVAHICVSLIWMSQTGSFQILLSGVTHFTHTHMYI